MGNQVNKESLSLGKQEALSIYLTPIDFSFIRTLVL